MSIINSNNTTGLVYFSDSSGTLNLQTQGNTALSINSSQTVTVSSSMAAISSTSGALVVTGGIGTSGNIFASGNIFQNGAQVTSLPTMIAYQLAL